MFRNVSINNLILLPCCLLLLIACAPTGIYHTVKPGQTLYRIAKTYDVDEAQLARVNRISDPTQLKAEQRLFIPGATRLRSVPVAVSSKATSPSPKPTPPAAVNNSTKQPAGPATASQERRPAEKKPAPAKTASQKQPAKGTFIWPLKGKLLNKFGAQGKKIYKGIEIGVPQGTPVVAAASGKVIYSGNAIAGYGNLVILEHSDSYFSIYGFNQKTLVKMDDHVGQGEKIALSGLPPNGQSARLHFEIRQGKSAVNPILYLP